ncbi:MAG TPA: ATP12 family protein [Xanthobacteraceae bacterium]|jgi:chaperone required for assembly of F1-ATPase|nr:ATP12 family protein [Xanthobacteraceae bacterium]
MRDLFEDRTPLDPMSAARRGAKAALRRRFYRHATALSTPAGFAVSLDDKPVFTPKRRPLAAPTLALAEALAAEWEAQQENIDPAAMPLTRLANAIIDGVADAPAEVRAEIEKYLGTDLLFYRADAPELLRQRQAQHWDPVLAWAREALGADFKLGEGVVHVTQPETARGAAAAAIPNDPWRLGAVHVITTLTGSALLALAMLHKRISAEQAWLAAHVDEDWNMEQWGRDELALERRAFRLAEFQAAAKILSEPGEAA